MRVLLGVWNSVSVFILPLCMQEGVAEWVPHFIEPDMYAVKDAVDGHMNLLMCLAHHHFYHHSTQCPLPHTLCVYHLITL